MGRSPCCEKGHTNKGAWTKEEDQRLVAYIRVNGDGCWRSLPKAAGLQRCGKSCRLRWMNYLRPDLKRGNFTEEEDRLIVKHHYLLGNKWSVIAARLPGRTDNEIKNYWNAQLKKRFVDRDGDPRTQNHLPPTITHEVHSQTKPKLPVVGLSSLTTSCMEEGENLVSDRINLELSISLPFYTNLYQSGARTTVVGKSTETTATSTEFGSEGVEEESAHVGFQY